MGRTQTRNVIFGALFALVFLFACKNPNTHKPDVELVGAGTLVTSDAQSKEYTVDTSASMLYWKAYKLMGSGHDGGLRCNGGKILMKDSLPVGGEVIMNMESTSVMDIEDSEKNANLVSHLKDADFFETGKYPLATLKILGAYKKEGKKALVKVSLEIKGSAREIELPVTVVWNQGFVDISVGVGVGANVGSGVEVGVGVGVV